MVCLLWLEPEWPPWTIARCKRTASGQVEGTPNSVAGSVSPNLAGKWRMGLCSFGEG